MDNEIHEKINNSSPGQLEDVTMESSYQFGGFRSPSFNMPLPGSMSPGQGRSLREHDEQLNALRKENFNLKLRIYFLEEKNPSNAISDGSESLFKQNVDLKVETEALRKELKEKHDLLCEAATALELMEQAQKKCQEESFSTIEELKQKVQFLEMEIKALEKLPNSNYSDLVNRTDVDAQHKIAELENFIIEYEKQTAELTNKLDDQALVIKEKDEQIKEVDYKLNQINYENSELKEKLQEKDSKWGEADFLLLKDQLYDHKKNLAEKECMLQIVEEKLQKKTECLEKGSKNNQMMMSKIKTLEAEMKRLKGDVNKTESLLEGKELDNKSNHIMEINDLKTQLKAALRDAEEAHAWRKECADVCGMLTIRLKELAEFLDSLLKHKDILGVVATDRRKAMRKAVDKSLDLSKSLNNISLSISGRLSLNETNLLQFTSFADSLNTSIENKENQQINTNVDFNGSQAMVIENLRTEVRNLKGELEKNNKKEKRCFSLLVDPNSESEAWSEPDRKVSYARIGLEDTSKHSSKSRSPNKYNEPSNSTTASEDGSSRMSRKNSTLKLQDKIAELEQLISERDDKILSTQCALVEADNRLKEGRFKLIALTTEVENYKSLNESLEMEIEDLKQKIDSDSIEILRVKTELEQKHNLISKITTERDTSAVDLRVAILKLSALQSDYDEQRQRYQTQIDEIMVNQKNNMDKTISDLLEKHKTEMNNIEIFHKNILAKDWISQDVHEEKLHQLNDVNQHLIELQSHIDFMKDNEVELNAQILNNEKTMRMLRKNLDDATLQASKIVLDRTKITSDKLTVDKINNDLLNRLDEANILKTGLNSRIAHLEKTNAMLQNKLVVNDTKYQLTRSASHGNARYTMIQQFSDQSHSGYTSDEVKIRLENSSPDLGIESDAGRTSGSDVIRMGGGGGKEVKGDLAASMKNIFLEDEEEVEIVINNKSSNSLKQSKILHDCEKIEQENTELKRKLIGQHNAYKNILAQLRISNSRKEQVERDIRREICKTQNVLKNVRTNIESVEQSNKNTGGGYKSDQS